MKKLIKLINEILAFLGQALETLWDNKMRSILTMLGVVIGVFAVITLVAIGEGAKQYIYDQVSSFGTGSTYMEARPGKDHGPMSMTEKLTYQDAEAIEKYCTNVSAVDPRVYGAGEIKYGKEKMTLPIIMAVSYKYPEVLSHKVVMGRFFNKSEEATKKKVCIIGQKIVSELLSGANPVGERVKINSKSYTVIGVFENKGSFFGFDYNKIVVIPITSGQQLFDTKKLMEVGIKQRMRSFRYFIKDIKKRISGSILRKSRFLW
jgi:putative ABC transport system permease protein